MNRHGLFLILAASLTWPFSVHPGEMDHNHERAHDPAIETDHEHHDEERHNHEEAPGAVHLTPEQVAAAGIEVSPLAPRPVPEALEAPGEVRLNLYATSRVTPRITAQVVGRHARMGDRVEKDQPLVTLSSAEMAEAQGAFIIAAREWQRVKRLGLNVVSEQRHLEAQVTYQQAWSRLLAYGMTPSQVQALADEGDVSRADGSFRLLSPQSGTVIRDPFVLGQMVAPGDLLFEITDEATAWVEAHLDPARMERVAVGAPARVRANGRWIEGRVIQVHHALEETTRTLGIRIEVPNPGDHLHPGQFVTTRIHVGEGTPQLALPPEAVLRGADGDWQVFVEKAPGEFEPVEVELVKRLPGLAIIDGIPPGTPVVTRGAFFLQSELAKSGFEIHNH